MHWTSKDEKGMIKEWAQECGTEEISNQILPFPVKEEESYWCLCDKGRDIIEYGFNTALELKNELREELKEDYYEELIVPLAAAAFKEKMAADDKISSNNNAIVHSGDENLTIPEFVYAF